MADNGLYRFRLYVAGDGPNSTRAIANLRAFCRDNLEDRHEIEIVDVFEDPNEALENGVLLTPTLAILSPAWGRTIVGDLSDSEVLIRAVQRDR